MTEEQIIKALEERIKALKDDYKRLQALDAPMDCFEESHIDNIRVLSNALDLINRTRAENERYKGVIKLLEKDVADAKSEAYKEFAEGLKEISREHSETNARIVYELQIDNLVKERVGEANG